MPAYKNGADQIGTDEQLAWFMYKVNTDAAHYGSANAVLTADIDLTGAQYYGTEALPFRWAPIGVTTAKPYCGVFDGQGHVIKNLRVQFERPIDGATSYLGFFGVLGSGAAVSNLFLQNVSVVAPPDGSNRNISMGAFAGRITGSAAVRCCCVFSGSTQATSTWKYLTHGGFAGECVSASGSIADCFSNVQMVDNTNGTSGAFLGYTNSYTGTLQSCFVAGSVSGSNKYVGGTFGVNAQASNCFYLDLLSLSATPGSQSVTLAQASGGQLRQSLNAGRSPFIWYEASPYHYASGGYPVPLGYSLSGWNGIGGLIQAGAALTAQQKSAVAAGQDYTSVTLSNGYEKKTPLPRLLYASDTVLVAPAAAVGGVYQIGSAEQFAWYAYQVNHSNGSFQSSKAVLTADIDLTGAPYGGSEAVPLVWTPVGSAPSPGGECPFRGSFNGRGHVVAGLYLNCPVNNYNSFSNYGLFGTLAGSAVLDSLLLKNVNIRVTTGSIVCIGSAAGFLLDSAQVKNCGVLSGKLTQSGNASFVAVGGIVGDMQIGTAQLVQGCFSLATISTSGKAGNNTSGAGGIVGRQYRGSVKNCYAAGPVTGVLTGGKLGGLIGSLSGGAQPAFAYYDQQVTGAAGAGSALATSQMKSLAALEGLNSGLKDASGTPYEAFVFDVTGENGGYPLLVFGQTDAGEAFFTTRKNTVTVAPNLAAGEVLIPANVTGTASASIKADSAFTAVFDLCSYMPGVPAGKDSPSETAHPYPALQSAVLDLGAGGLPKGTAIVLAYRSGGQNGNQVYLRAYAKYVAAAAVPNGQVSLTAFTPMAGGSLALADLLHVAKQQLVVYVDYTGVAGADNTKHSGEVSLICTGQNAGAENGTEVLAGSHDLTAPAKMPTLTASDPAAPTAYSLAFSSTLAGDTAPFQAGDLKLTAVYSGGSQSADNAKGAALGAVVCLKDEAGKSQPLTGVTFSADGGATWADPSNLYYMVVPGSGKSLYARGLSEAQAQQLTAQLYSSATQIDAALPRGAHLVAETQDAGSSAIAASYALRAEGKPGDTRVYEVNAAGNRLAVVLTAQPERLPAGCTLKVQLLKKQPNGDYGQAGGLLTASGELKPGQNTFTLAGTARAGTYRLLFTLSDPQGTIVASAPYNFLLRAEA